MTDFKGLIAKVAGGKALTREEAEAAFEVMMSGEATPSQMGGFVMALRVRGETVDEIAGAVSIMRSKMLRVEAPPDAMDVVGTGGDAAGTYNISTTTAFVVAGAGVPVAKHGNRALSSKSGAADVLGALGVKIDLGPEAVARCIREAGIGFMFAPAHHSAMKHVGPTRVELGTRTIFNLIGPLSNPAGVGRMLVGVFAPEWVEPLADRASRPRHGKRLGGPWRRRRRRDLGRRPDRVAAIKNGEVTTFTVSPEDVNMAFAPSTRSRAATPRKTPLALSEVLRGAPGAYRDTVLLNAAAALVIAGKAEDLLEGVRLAAASIDEGRARARLERLVAVSNG